MKKNLTRLISLFSIALLIVGLAGCGSKQSENTKSESSVKTTKVKKEKSSSSNSKKKNNSSISNSTTSQTSKNTSQGSASISSNTSSSSNSNTSQEVQLGLGDVAVWTDSKGITHHVDSDGMDRQTTSGNSKITYQDWSGSLPSNAQVIHQN